MKTIIREVLKKLEKQGRIKNVSSQGTAEIDKSFSEAFIKIKQISDQKQKASRFVMKNILIQ